MIRIYLNYNFQNWLTYAMEVGGGGGVDITICEALRRSMIKKKVKYWVRVNGFSWRELFCRIVPTKRAPCGISHYVSGN